MAKHLRFSLQSSAFVLASVCFASVANAQKPAILSSARFGATHAVPQNRHASVALLSRLSQQNPTAISVATADFYEDSTRSLVTGYALGNGGALALQGGLKTLPRVEEMATRAAFQPDANFIDLGIRPDFLKTADVNGDAHQDLIVASRGGSSIQVLLGDGKGNFVPQAPIAVNGQITALTPLHSITGQRLIAAGVCGTTCSVNLFQFDGTMVARVPLDDKITILEVARFNGTASDDLVAGGASKLFLVDGKSALTASPRLDRLPITGAVSAITGSFVYDARGAMRQIAVLTSDGTLHTLARTGLIAQPSVSAPVAHRNQLARRRPFVAPLNPGALSWVEVETLNNIAQFDAEATPTLLWSRIGGSGMDNVLILNANGGRITTVLHQVVQYPATQPGETSSMKALPARIEMESSSSGTITGAIAMRTAQDMRFGMVMARSKAAPEFDELKANRTLTVNTSSDGGVTSSSMNACINGTANSCTLRSALAVSDADATSNETNAKADTVNVPAGTYQLSKDGPELVDGNEATGQPDQYGDIQYHIEIYGPTNLISTAATPGGSIVTSNNNDKVFSENSEDQNGDTDSSQPPMDFYMSGFTLENGTNADATYADLQGGAITDNQAGLMDLDTGGTGYITFMNDTFMNGTAPGGPGGAITVTDNYYNFTETPGYGNGIFDAENCTFSGNSSEETAGALSVGDYVPMTISGSTFSSNSIPQSTAEQADNSSNGYGGAIAWLQDQYTENAPESSITTSVFTSNYGTHTNAETGLYANGGAIYAEEALEITNSVFTGNTAGNSGGAIFVAAIEFTNSITGNTFTGNQGTYGGAINIVSSEDGESAPTNPQTSTVEYNAISGNKATSLASTSGIGLGDFNNPQEHYTNDTVTAIDNFWGCNTGANTSGCDNTAVESTQGGTLIVSPYAVLTASLNSTTITEGNSVQLTGYLDTDSSGSPIGTLNGFSNLSASLSIVDNSSTIATETTTLNAGGTSLSAATTSAGPGTATITVKNATVSKSFTVQPGAPVADGQSVSVAYSSAVNITLGATGQGTITYNIVGSPSHGTISNFSATAGTLTYTAAAGYVGADSFTFNASNGSTSNTATVSITIGHIQPGISLSAPATANRGTAAALVATFTAPAGAPTPTASVSFTTANSTLLGSSGLTQTSSTTYTATLNAANLPAGQQTLLAFYPGDSDYSSALAPGQSVSVIANNIWVGNSSGTTSAFNATGTPYLNTPEPDGGYGIAIDNSGNVWSINSASSSIAEFSETGSVLSSGYSGGGQSTPAAVVIDGSGRVWITNVTNSVSVLNSSGQPVSASAYTGTTPGSATPYLSTPTSISVDGSGNLWIGNSGNSTVTELLGAATPTLAPLASGVAGNKSATRP